MTRIVDIVDFHSDAFAPVLPEDSQVNPEVYGAELAFWLCTELAKRGVVTSYPEYEDWGWYIDTSLSLVLNLPYIAATSAVRRITGCCRFGDMRERCLAETCRHLRKQKRSCRG